MYAAKDGLHRESFEPGRPLEPRVLIDPFFLVEQVGFLNYSISSEQVTYYGGIFVGYALPVHLPDPLHQESCELGLFHEHADEIVVAAHEPLVRGFSDRFFLASELQNENHESDADDYCLDYRANDD